MKKIGLLLFALVSMCNYAQTIWTGSIITFTKENNADWTLEANQDRITNNVWITRADNRGIFNIVVEAVGGQAGTGPEPSDTQWAFGKISDGVENLTFSTWGSSHGSTTGGNPPSLIGLDMVLHLISDDIYMDIKFLSWSGSGSGGGFSYQRSSDQNLSMNSFNLYSDIKIFPNPSSKAIQLNGFDNISTYEIFDIQGSKIANGFLSKHQKLDIQYFNKGLYFLKLENGRFLKFIKE